MQKAAKSTPSGVRLSRLRRPSNQNCLDEFTSPDECGQTNSSKIVRASFKLDHVRRRMSSDELQLLGVKFAICPELTPDSSNYLHLRFTTEYGRRAGWNLQSIRTRPDVSPSTVDGRVGVLEFAINCASRPDEFAICRTFRPNSSGRVCNSSEHVRVCNSSELIRRRTW